ncbi:MAG: FkbM family methyltransferase [Candidatus Glassbacteria bacterium]|nr:FkbM family methyltransferase [Candidatus Glassbacteria bacterium]
MTLNLRDRGISRSLYYQGEREKAFMSLLERTVRPGMVCLDIGANIGYTTLFMLRGAGDSGFVYAAEPDPHNLELLRTNVAANGFRERCEITPCAISGRTGEIDFWLAGRPNVSSVDKTAESVRKIRVQAYDLGTFLAGRKFPGLIKMDVEGHEVKVFEGGLDYFASHTGPVSLLVEVHPAYYGESNDFARVLREYFRLKFNTRYVISTPFARPRLFAEAGYSPKETVYTDGFHRGIYDDISNEDLVRFACREHHQDGYNKIVRAFMLSRD